MTALPRKGLDDLCKFHADLSSICCHNQATWNYLRQPSVRLTNEGAAPGPSSPKSQAWALLQATGTHHSASTDSAMSKEWDIICTICLAKGDERVRKNCKLDMKIFLSRLKCTTT